MTGLWVVASGSSFASAEDGVGVPDVVTEAIETGGSVHGEVLELDMLTPPGTAKSGTARLQASTDAKATTFDEPVRYAYLELARDGGRGGSLSEADLGDLDPFYLAVQRVDDVAVSTVQITAEGEFAALGGLLPDEVAAIADVVPGEAVLSDGRFGELYRASTDMTEVRALNEPARALVGDAPVEVADFRVIKAEQWIDYEATVPDDLPDDAVGAMPDGAPSASTRESGTPAFLVALGGCGTGQRSGIPPRAIDSWRQRSEPGHRELTDASAARRPLDAQRSWSPLSSAHDGTGTAPWTCRAAWAARRWSRCGAF